MKSWRTLRTSCSCLTRGNCCGGRWPAAEQKGETPVFAGRLKQIMLSLDSSFNEANYGYQQFRAFLEGQLNMITLQEVDMQLYVRLRKPGDPPGAAVVGPLSENTAPPIFKPAADIDPSQRFRSFLREAGLRVIDAATRQQVLVDFLAAVQSAATPLSLNQAADLLKDRYDAENALTQKIAVAEMMRLLVMSDALRYEGGQPGSDAPLLDPQALALDELNAACDCVYVSRIVEGGIAVDAEALAPVLYGPGAGSERVQALCQRLASHGFARDAEDGCAIAAATIDRLLNREELLMAAAAVAKVALPPGEPTVALAESLFREASDLRQKDFAGSAQRYLQAARVQLDAVRGGTAAGGVRRPEVVPGELLLREGGARVRVGQLCRGRAVLPGVLRAGAGSRLRVAAHPAAGQPDGELLLRNRGEAGE